MTTSPSGNPVPKVHPATRPIEPEDPMNLHAFEVSGDTELMLRVVVEEYARMGCPLEAIMSMFRDPFYQAPHGLLHLYGEERLRERVVEILGRCGVMRTTTSAAAPPPNQVVQLDIPGSQPAGGTSGRMNPEAKTASSDLRESSRPAQPAKKGVRHRCRNGPPGASHNGA